jgi:endoglucanase
MRRGVNLGNALEAPNEGEWGYRIDLAHLNAIASAGFDGVRLPVRWDVHAESAPPYIIDPGFLDRVDQVSAAALERGLKVQIDCHHYDQLIAMPDAELARYLSIWRQLAEFYAGASPDLMFEPLNEPHGDRLRGARLTALQQEVLGVIRESNPTRLIVFGPGQWNAIDALTEWTPPRGENIAASVHYYEPHEFTHQNAVWLGAEAPRYEREWGAAADLQRVARHARRAADWASANEMALQLGEFGVNLAAPRAQRAAWTRAVRRAFADMDAAWCIWDFAGAFPIWDSASGAFMPEMLDALLG